MQAKREYRDRDDAEVAVLDALVDRSDEGMTVFELRSGVDLEVDIDDLEEALAELKQAELITVENGEETVRIYPAARVVPDNGTESGGEPSLLEKVRDRLGL